MGFNIHILSGRSRSLNLAAHAAVAASFNPYWQVGLHCTLLRIGIVPPARNLALSPETAVTVGSASV